MLHGKIYRRISRQSNQLHSANIRATERHQTAQEGDPEVSKQLPGSPFNPVQYLT